MNETKSEELKNISERVIECWTRIKAKARARGDITNIEKYAPCITAALNSMEQFLIDYTKEQIKLNRLERARGEEQKQLAQEIPLYGTDGD